MRGLFDRFMRAFTHKVEAAIAIIDSMDLGVSDLSAVLMRVEVEWALGGVVDVAAGA